MKMCTGSFLNTHHGLLEAVTLREQKDRKNEQFKWPKNSSSVQRRKKKLL